MIQADHRLNTAGDQFINKPVVESDPLFIKFAVAQRTHPTPGNLEAIAVHPQILHQVEIFPVTMV